MEQEGIKYFHAIVLKSSADYENVLPIPNYYLKNL